MSEKSDLRRQTKRTHASCVTVVPKKMGSSMPKSPFRAFVMLAPRRRVRTSSSSCCEFRDYGQLFRVAFLSFGRVTPTSYSCSPRTGTEDTRVSTPMATATRARPNVRLSFVRALVLASNGTRLATQLPHPTHLLLLFQTKLGLTTRKKRSAW